MLAVLRVLLFSRTEHVALWLPDNAFIEIDPDYGLITKHVTGLDTHWQVIHVSVPASALADIYRFLENNRHLPPDPSGELMAYIRLNAPYHKWHAAKLVAYLLQIAGVRLVRDAFAYTCEGLRRELLSLGWK